MGTIPIVVRVYYHFSSKQIACVWVLRILSLYPFISNAYLFTILIDFFDPRQ
jgi:hypothetical protein